MFEYLYEWLRNLSFYLILVTAVMYILPANGYRKYIRFFTGLVLILMILTPVFELFGTEYTVTDYFDGYDFEKNMKKIEDEMREIDGNVNRHSEIQIEVEDIVIGS